MTSPCRTVACRWRAAAAAVLLLAGARAGTAQTAAEAEAFERRVAAAAERGGRSVVALAVRREEEPSGREQADLLFQRPEEWLSATIYRRSGREAPASGVVVTAEGDILTSFAHVGGEIRRVEVLLPDGGRRPAELVGFDQTRDLALLRADVPGVVVPEMAPDPPKVGQWALALGRVPDAARVTVTAGIVSARRRMRGEAVQVDARLNYGNVGGPLVDLEGRLLGVTCNVGEGAEWGQNSGVGFAIPWNRIEDLLPQLQDGLRRKVTPRPYIGVKGAEGALDVQGAPVEQVFPHTPADRAGLKDGDVIVKVGDESVATWEEFATVIRNCKIGEEIRLTVERNGETKVLRVRVAGRAEE